MATAENTDGVARRQLVLVLADMVAEALASRNVMRYSPGDEEEVRNLQGDVLADDDMAEVLQSSVQGKGVPPEAQGSTEGSG